MNYEALSTFCLAKKVVLVAVSKTQPIDAIKSLYNQGQRIFGENKVQEILEKKDLLPLDIEWHLIGHLQSNKIKQILPFVSMIHSVDSEKLATELQNEAIKINKILPILLQLKIAKEDTKFGMDQNELNNVIKKCNDGHYPNLVIEGLMGMASFVDDKAQIREEFQKLKSSFDRVKSELYDQSKFNHISMGMSGDYELAIEEGSTMVRIGSLLFGQR